VGPSPEGTVTKSIWSALYKALSVRIDASAVRRGKVARRIARKYAGRSVRRIFRRPFA